MSKKAQCKALRAAFNAAVFARAKDRCEAPDCEGKATRATDAHHIVPRKRMENDGYAKENGIALCGPCHVEAEEYYRVGKCRDGYQPAQLYERIGSSFERSVEACKRLT